MAITNEELSQLLVREQDKLKAYVWQLVRDAQLVGDVLQEMALIATRKSDQIQDAEHFPPWARITCRHLALKALEKRKRFPLLLSDEALDLLESQWRRFDRIDSFDLVALLRDCVKNLGQRHGRSSNCVTSPAFPRRLWRKNWAGKPRRCT